MKYYNKGGITRHSGCPVCGKAYKGNFRDVNKLLTMHMKVAHNRTYQDYDRPKIGTEGTGRVIGFLDGNNVQHSITEDEFEAACIAIPENAKPGRI